MEEADHDDDGRDRGTVNWNPPPHHAGPVRLSEITQTKADDGTYVMWTGDEWRSS